MLKATPFGSFFGIVVSSLTMGQISPDGLSTWAPGKSLVGVTTRGRLLTDGRKGDEFAGCPWVEKWDHRPGYILLRGARINVAAFTQSDIPAVFVGNRVSRPGYDNGVIPTLIAVPKGMLVENVELPKRVERSYGHRDAGEGWFSINRDLIFSAVKSGLPVSISMGQIDKNDCCFRPRRPLTRTEWESIGFYIPTREHTAINGVLPIVQHRDNSGVVLPITFLDQMPGIGITGVAKQLMRSKDGDCLVVIEALVSEPEKAGKAMPYLKSAQPGTVLRPGGGNPFCHLEKTATISVTEAEKLIELPTTLKVGSRVGEEMRIELPFSAVRVRPGEHVIGIVNGVGRSMFIEKERVDSVVTPARKIAPIRVIPKDAVGYTVFAGGVQLQGNHYLNSEVATFDLVKSNRAILKEREESLSGKHQRPLPDGWKNMDDAQVAGCLVWEDRKRDGWLTRLELSTRLQGFTWNDRDFPLECAEAKDREAIYRPITMDEMFSHAGFAVAMKNYLGEHTAFVLSCMMSAIARQAIAADAFVA